MTFTLEEPRRGILLEALSGLSSDSEADAHPLAGFLPLREHSKALMPGILVVAGARGAGKTALFKALRECQRRDLRLDAILPGNPLEALQWIEGFSEDSRLHPPVGVLQEFLHRSDDAMLRRFWLGHLVGRIWQSFEPACECPLPAWNGHAAAPSRWIDEVSVRLESLFQWLDRLDEWAERTDRWIIVSYDHLDRISSGREGLRDHYIQALLGLWMSLANRTRRIRCKVFLRTDLLQGLRDLPDASKFAARTISLDWTVESLFRMLVRRMAAMGPLNEWFQEAGIPLKPHPDLGWMPPDAMPESAREAFVSTLAPPVMGRGIKKGATHRWIPNHLQDARGSIVPRSLLNLMALAAEEALRAGYQGTHLLAPVHLAGALVGTSTRRFNEVLEEHSVVRRLEVFRNRTAPFEAGPFHRDIGAHLSTEDDYGQDGRQVTKVLINLGLISERLDGRIDVPDIYRFGLDIRRKGGVKQPE